MLSQSVRDEGRSSPSIILKCLWELRPKDIRNMSVFVNTPFFSVFLDFFLCVRHYASHLNLQFGEKTDCT